MKLFCRIIIACSHYVKTTEYFFCFDYAHLLRANKHLMECNAMLARGSLVSNDPMFWASMGNNPSGFRTISGS